MSGVETHISKLQTQECQHQHHNNIQQDTVVAPTLQLHLQYHINTRHQHLVNTNTSQQQNTQTQSTHHSKQVCSSMPKSKRICNKKHSPDAPRAVLIQKSSLRGHATLSSPSPSPSPSPPASPSLTPPSATTPPSDYSPPFIELKYTSKSHVHHAPCVECGARATPEWRAGPAGASTLCNACGIRWKKLRHKQKELQVKKNRATKVKGKELHTVAATIPKAEEDEEFVARSSPASEVDGNASQDMDVDLDLAVTGDPSEHSSCAEASPSASDCEMIVRGFTPPKGFDDCNSYQTLPSVIRIPSPPQVFSSQLFTVSTEVRPDGDYSVLPPLPLDLVLNNILDS